jgi:hypothetical protein
MDTIGKIVMGVLNHFDRNERAYKYVVFPLLWVMGLYAAGVAFFILMQALVEMVE